MDAKYLTSGTGDQGMTSLGKRRIHKSNDIIIGMGFLNICESYIAQLPDHDKHIREFCNDVINHFYHIKAFYHVGEGIITDEQIDPFVGYLNNFLAKTNVPRVNFFIRPIKKNAKCFEANGYVRLTECFVRKLEGSEPLGRYLNRLSSCLHAVSLYVITPEEVEQSNVNYKPPKKSQPSFWDKDISKWMQFLGLMVILFMIVLLVFGV